ncbi:galanin-activated signaling pathway [Homalodisca vitripennis]|nr:galanin-activated signaling pathway [Homalodisca vitripennis]
MSPLIRLYRKLLPPLRLAILYLCTVTYCLLATLYCVTPFSIKQESDVFFILAENNESEIGKQASITIIFPSTCDREATATPPSSIIEAFEAQSEVMEDNQIPGDEKRGREDRCGRLSGAPRAAAASWVGPPAVSQHESAVRVGSPLGGSPIVVMSGESVGEAVGYTQCINQTKGNQSDLFLTFCQPNVSGAIPDDMEPELRVMEQIVSIVVPVLFGIIIILGLFGNALVVIVVSANQQMRSTTNLLIINLAVADLCFIVFCVPFTATDYILPFWPFGDTWCKMVQYLIVVTAYASVYTLVLMSLDRFLAVVHPIASMSVRTERNAIMAIGITWIVILLTSIPVFLSHGEVTYYYSSTEHTACVFLERDPVNRPDGFNKPAFQVGWVWQCVTAGTGLTPLVALVPLQLSLII